MERRPATSNAKWWRAVGATVVATAALGGTAMTSASAVETSQNGWTVVDPDGTRMVTIGESTQVRIRKGDVSVVLGHFGRWFDNNVENVDGGVLDDWGWADRPIGGSTVISNHASGTAIDLNATQHPRFTRPVDNFSDAQIRAIRNRLPYYDGVIRWGGDYSAGNKDPMHFEINAGRARVSAVADKIRATGACDTVPHC